MTSSRCKLGHPIRKEHIISDIAITRILNGFSFLQYIGNMPDNNVAGVFFGKSKIVSKGIYTFCTSSDDG